MPIISLEDQGFNSGARMIMQGLAGFRARKEFEKEMALREKSQKLQEDALAEQKLTGDLTRQRLQKQLNPTPLADLVAQAVQGGFEPTEGAFDPVSGPGLKFRKKLPPPVVPSNMRLGKMSVDEQGNSTSTFEPNVVPTPPKLIELDLPDGSGKGMFLERTSPDGRTEFVPYNPSRQGNEKPVGDELLNKLNVTALALGQLPRMEELVNSSGDAGGPIAGPFNKFLSNFTGPNKEQLAFENIQAQTLAPLAKGILGETGALSDADMKRYAPLLPQYSDTREARQQKLASLRSLLTSQQASMLDNLKATGRDTTALLKTPGMQVPGAPGAPITREQAMAEAQKALDRGANPEAVKRRLQELGFPTN